MMPTSSFASYIQATVPVTASALAEILAAYTPRILRKNEFLLHQGEVSNEYLFLEEGILRAFTLDPQGNEITTFFYTSDQMVFEVASLFTRTTAGESMQALTDCRGYSLTLDQLNALFHRLPEFREFGRRMLVRGFADFKLRTLALISQTAEERYRHLLATNPALFQHAQLRHIASYLGVTDSSLSRIRSAGGKKPLRG
ncbi:MAG: Crp/Fnr family transcriptional regulator [Bacteroidota bacterium]|nr:Crp/Fnr family transcriptional regulator [Bacteroidota bacterium]